MKTLYILNDHEVKNSNSEDCLDDLVRLRECSLVSELVKDIVSVIRKYILCIPRTDGIPTNQQIKEMCQICLIWGIFA